MQLPSRITPPNLSVARTPSGKPKRKPNKARKEKSEGQREYWSKMSDEDREARRLNMIAGQEAARKRREDNAK